MALLPIIPPQFQADYQEYDREITLRKTRLGCILGIVLVPVPVTEGLPATNVIGRNVLKD